MLKKVFAYNEWGEWVEQEDTRLPYEKISLEGKWGSRYPEDDEGYFTGDYEGSVRSELIGNQQHYHFTVYPYHSKGKKRSKLGYQVTIRVIIDHSASSYGDEVAQFKVKTLKLAKMRIADEILTFEKSNRLAELWKEHSHPRHRKQVLQKQKDGSLLWIFSSWLKYPHYELEGTAVPWYKKEFERRHFPFGIYYYRQEEWKSVWSQEEKFKIVGYEFEKYRYHSHDRGYYGYCGSGAQEQQKEIDQAIWDVNDLVSYYAMVQRYVKGLISV